MLDCMPVEAVVVLSIISFAFLLIRGAIVVFKITEGPPKLQLTIADKVVGVPALGVVVGSMGGAILWSLYWFLKCLLQQVWGHNG